MKVIDLYCGAGGFSLGFKQAGFDIMLGVDIWNKALETYELNIKSEILNKDVRELRKYNLPECDVLIGSPPCPDFSIAKFRGSGIMFLKEEKGYLLAIILYQKKINLKVLLLQQLLPGNYWEAGKALIIQEDLVNG